MVNVPSPVSIGLLGMPASSSVRLISSPPMLTVSIPASALMVMLPVIGVVLASITLRSPAAAPLLSSTSMIGAPSVTPLMVIVNVVVELSPSASVITYSKVSSLNSPSSSP